MKALPLLGEADFENKCQHVNPPLHITVLFKMCQMKPFCCIEIAVSLCWMQVFFYFICITQISFSIYCVLSMLVPFVHHPCLTSADADCGQKMVPLDPCFVAIHVMLSQFIGFKSPRYLLQTRGSTCDLMFSSLSGTLA